MLADLGPGIRRLLLQEVLGEESPAEATLGLILQLAATPRDPAIPG